MTTDFLVAYATKHGTTQEVAETVTEELKALGLEVELRRLRKVRDLDGYRAVVIGAPLYAGRWQKDARRFLKRHGKALAEHPVAVFALGPLKLTEEDIAGSRKQLDRALALAPELRPATVEVFGGAIDPTKLRFPFSRMEAADARDWDAIRAWARSLPGELLGGSFGQRDGDRPSMTVSDN
ncbi:MAG TPA: flavodoxin domain-containing protein [Gaiellaceae bacterium]|nr:flavodoxin domain-containing protein [Gaiellaceae bacterium]